MPAGGWEWLTPMRRSAHSKAIDEIEHAGQALSVRGEIIADKYDDAPSISEDTISISEGGFSFEATASADRIDIDHSAARLSVIWNF
jgi:hypothetical protein